MEKIKNLLVPGKAKDDETLYGSGQTGDNQTKHVGDHGGLTGEGSHFTQAKENTSGVPVEQTGNPATMGTTEPHRTTGEGSHLSQVENTAPGVTSGQTGNQTSTATSGLPSTTATAADNAPITGASTTHDHHLGRDAAAVGEGVHHHHHHHPKGTAYNDTVLGSNASTGERVPETSNSGHDHHHTGEHHLGRDAAALGAAGATGEAVHHHHEKEKTAGLAGQPGSTTTATSLGKNDYDREAVLAEHERLKAQTGGVGYIPNTGTPSSNVAGTETHRHGRDVALGAGAVGAAGVAEHEHHKHHTGTGQTASTTGEQFPSNTASGTNQLSQGADPYASNTETHRHGRDAALGAGAVGAAGVAEHEHHKHHTGTGQTATTTGEQFPSNTASGTNQLSQGADPYASNTLGNTDPTSTHGQTHDHHYGRDAAIGAGVGGAAYEADKHFKHDKDLTPEEREAKKEHKHELKEEKKEYKKGGLLSFLHRDKSKKYTPEEEAEFDRQEREHHESHKGRDAALGAGAVGAAGAAYETGKGHHVHGDTDKPLPSAPGNHGVGTGVNPESGLDSDRASTTAIHQGHVGQTGTLEGASAGAGAAGLAEAEHVKHQDHAHGAVPLHEKPIGTDIGDKLHGVARNRGVPGSSGFPGTEGYDTGVAQSGIATGATTGGMTQPTATGAEYGSSGHATHIGRDATIGTAGGEAAHLGHRKQDSGYAPGDKHIGEAGVTPLQGQTYPQESGITQSNTATQPAGVQSGLDNNTFGSGLADSGTGTTTTDGRNRLHKEPPVGHTTGL